MNLTNEDDEDESPGSRARGAAIAGGCASDADGDVGVGDEIESDEVDSTDGEINEKG